MATGLPNNSLLNSSRITPTDTVRLVAIGDQRAIAAGVDLLMGDWGFSPTLGREVSGA